MLSSKSKIVLLKRGGSIWVTEAEAQIIGEAMLAEERLVDIQGQLIQVSEIRGLVNADTYQTTQERAQELRQRENTETNLPASRSDCKNCGGARFIIDSKPRFANGIEYGPTAIPCDQCNPNPPELSY